MLHSVVTDLRSRLPGRRVLRVFQTARAQAVIELQADRPPGQLVLSSCPTFGRIHIDDGLEPDPSVNFPFGAVLQRWLRSAVVTDIEQRGFDRAVRITFANARALGPQSRCVFVLEIMGRHSNAILADGDGIVLEAVTHVLRDRNRYRQIVPGEPYVPPPDFGKHHPLALSPTEFAATIIEPATGVAEWLRATFQGMSDVFRAEVLARVGINPDLFAGDLTVEQFGSIQACLTDMLSEAEQPPAWVYTCPHRRFAYPIELASMDQCRHEPASDIHAAVATTATGEIAGVDAAELRRRLRDAVARAAVTVEKRIAERREYVSRARDAESVRRLGEALLTYGHLVPRGASEAVIPNPYDPEATLRIDVDPTMNTQANAQRFFAQYKKLTDTERRVSLFLKAARIEMEYIEGLTDRMERVDGIEDLALIEEELLAQGYLKRQGKHRARARASTPSQLPQATIDGYTVLWGRSGLQNDRLLRAAGPADIWMHAQKTPGGHVLIRTNRADEQPPDAVLIAAAQHAASLSSRHRDSRVAVDFTRARHVRRIKGTPPGYVHYTHQQTLTVAPRPLPAGD